MLQTFTHLHIFMDEFFHLSQRDVIKVYWIIFSQKEKEKERKAFLLVLVGGGSFFGEILSPDYLAIQLHKGTF